MEGPCHLQVQACFFPFANKHWNNSYKTILLNIFISPFALSFFKEKRNTTWRLLQPPQKLFGSFSWISWLFHFSCKRKKDAVKIYMSQDQTPRLDISVYQWCMICEFGWPLTFDIINHPSVGEELQRIYSIILLSI
jgi:hypothetical protein